MDNTINIGPGSSTVNEYSFGQPNRIPENKELTTFPVEKIISAPGGKVVKVKFDNTESTEEKVFVFCHDFAWKGACVFGSNCKYPHGYEYVGISSLAMQNDIIISKLNILLKNQDEIFSELQKIPCYNSRSHTTHHGSDFTTEYRYSLSNPSTSGLFDRRTETSIRRGRHQERSRGRGRGYRSRSNSVERSTKGQTSQDLKLLNRLTKFQIKD